MKKAVVPDTSTKNNVVAASTGNKIKIQPLTKATPSGSNGHSKQVKNPVFQWSKADIPGICVISDCNQSVPTDIPQHLANLFRERAKLLHEFPDGSPSVDLIETRICVNVGVVQLNDQAYQNAMAHGYPKINFKLVVERIIQMEPDISLLVTDGTARLKTVVWDCLLDDLKGAQSNLLSLEKGKNIALGIRRMARPG